MVRKTYDYGTQTRDDLYSIAKEIARKQNISGISRYTKSQLADFIAQYSESAIETVAEVEPTVEPVAEVEPIVDTVTEIEPLAEVEPTVETKFLKTEIIEIANYPVQIIKQSNEFKVAVAWDKTNFEPLQSDLPLVTYYALYRQVRELIFGLTAIMTDHYTIYENGDSYSIWFVDTDNFKDGFPTLELAEEHIKKSFPTSTIIQTPQTAPVNTQTTSTTIQTPTNFAKALVAHWRLSQADTTSEADRKRMWQECFNMCDELQEKMLKSYAESTVIKTFTPQYRKAIAIEANMLDPTLKGGYMYTAYPMAFWKVDQGARSEIDERTKISIGAKKKDAVRVSVDCREKLLMTANDLLSAPHSTNHDLWKKALSVSLLTGRRFYVEVCRNAEFFELENPSDFNRTLGFSGQAKGGIEKAKQIYEIPCYAEDIELLSESTEAVQNFIKSKEWYREDMDSKSFQSKIKSQCERSLSVFNAITMPYGFAMTIKDLRALYMCFAYYDYRVLSGKHPDIDTYLGSIAGHDVTTESGTYYRVGTTEHYKGFIDERWDKF